MRFGDAYFAHNKQPVEKIANHAWYLFWYVVPTLQMLLAFPRLLARFGFWSALALSALLTLCCYGSFALALKPCNIKLL